MLRRETEAEKSFPDKPARVNLENGTASLPTAVVWVALEALLKSAGGAKFSVHQMNTQEECDEASFYKRFSEWTEPFLQKTGTPS